MAARTISTTRRNPIPSAGAIVALAVVAGCRTNYAPLTYEYEAHLQQVSAWCYNNFGLTTASSAGQECVGRAWVGVPASDCQLPSCNNGYWPSASRSPAGAPYARRGPIDK